MFLKTAIHHRCILMLQEKILIELERQSQIVQSVMQDSQFVLSHLQPVCKLLVQGYNYDRYDKISRCDRICPVCVASILKMRFTFCLIAQNIHQLGTTFFNKIDNRIPNYKHIPISTLISS